MDVTPSFGGPSTASFDALPAFARSKERAKSARASVRLPRTACERPIARHLRHASNGLELRRGVALPQTSKVVSLSNQLFHKVSFSRYSRNLFDRHDALHDPILQSHPFS